jgi:hypothetical protein
MTPLLLFAIAAAHSGAALAADAGSSAARIARHSASAIIDAARPRNPPCA